MRPIEPLLALLWVFLPVDTFAFSLPFFSHDKVESEFVEQTATLSSRDVKIPKLLVEKIERDYRGVPGQAKGWGQEVTNRGLVNISAEFSQKRVAALHDNTRVRTPVGGGVIDLRDLVTPVKGLFSLKLIAGERNKQPMAEPHVFFVGRSKERHLDGEVYGVGCDKFLDISTPYRKKYVSQGFDLYTTDQRYLAVVGGTFIFVDYAPEALFVGGSDIDRHTLSKSFV